MYYFKDLTKTELKHLKDVAGVTTLESFKRTAEIMKADRARNPDIEPCYQCRAIARKLGLEV